MPLENGLDDRLITSSDLQQYFVNKANGEANAGGSIRFWVDTTRTTPKNVYELVQDLNTGNYSYVALSNPLTLSGVGTVIDTSNNDIPIYWFPYDGTPSTSLNNLELYYVEVFDSNNQLQFTREAWPYPLVEGGNAGPTISSLGIVNQLTNPQFTKVLFQQGTTVTIALVGNGTTTVDIAPGWTLSATHTASGNITVTQTPIAGTDHLPYNPPFMLWVTGNGSVTALSIYQQLNNNPDWAAPGTSLDTNGFLSGSILLGPGTGVNMQYVPSAGNAAQSIINTTNNTTAFEQFDATIQLTASNNPGNGITGYDRIVINFTNTTGTSKIGNVQVVPLTSNVTGVLFEQTPANRQLDQMFNYYKAGLDYKPIASYLDGWDFPLNPAQFLGKTVAASSTAPGFSKYVWDQTILFQSQQSGIGISQNSTGAIVLTAAAAGNTRSALVQYQEGLKAREMLNSSMSVTVRAFASANIVTTISLWYTTGASLPNVASGTGNSIVLTLDANGKLATFNQAGGVDWTEVPRSNLGDATFTVTTSSDLNYNEYNFSGWNLNGIAAVGTATFFAIVIGTGDMAQNTTLSIESISCVPGSVATRPAPLSPAQTLLNCQRYYWSSFPAGTVPAEGAAINNSVAYTCIVNGVGGVSIPVSFPAQMRIAPNPVTYYSPVQAGSAWYNSTGGTPTSGAPSAAVTVGTSNLSIRNPQVGTDVAGNTISIHVSCDSRLGIV